MFKVFRVYGLNWIKTMFNSLQDDVESLDGEDNDYSPRYTPSPILVPTFPPSQHSGKIFLEKDSGFRTTTQRKLTSKLPGNQIQPDLQKPTRTPLDLSLDSQRIFRYASINLSRNWNLSIYSVSSKECALDVDSQHDGACA